VASDTGLAADVVATALDDDALRAELHDRFQAAQREGVTGVPTFAYEGYAARGAVPPEHLERLVEGT
jgi:predicted DsbA family dithiol-disulfide isomerase